MDIDKFLSAVYLHDLAGMESMLEQAVSVNQLDGDGRTPLMHAVLSTQANDAVVRWLISHGADPNIADTKQEWTALHFAARDQKITIVTALLENGAAVDPQDCFGNTPLWRCVMHARPSKELVQLLLQYGADSEKKNKAGISPMGLAQRLGKADLF